MRLLLFLCEPITLTPPWLLIWKSETLGIGEKIVRRKEGGVKPKESFLLLTASPLSASQIAVY